MFLNSRKSREKREKQGPMNLSHTDLTNLTDGASLRPRLSALPSALSRMVHTSASDVCVREIRVKQKTTMEEDFVRSVRFV